jgi:hypothetical protein
MDCVSFRKNVEFEKYLIRDELTLLVAFVTPTLSCG